MNQIHNAKLNVCRLRLIAYNLVFFFYIETNFIFVSVCIQYIDKNVACFQINQIKWKIKILLCAALNANIFLIRNR